MAGANAGCYGNRPIIAQIGDTGCPAGKPLPSNDLVYFHEVDKGGHFAAWEQPQLFSSERRAAFRPLRRNSGSTAPQ
jgi:hypothetical protein